MSDPKMKTTLYAAKLRKRLAELQTGRKKALKKYENDVRQWKLDLAVWLRTNYNNRIDAIKNSELEDKYRRSDQPGFYVYKFFSGAPQPPVYPTDKVIRDIQRKIQYLAIIYSNDVYVSEEEVGRFFSGSNDDED
jgi:hypothetical protein